MEKSRIQGSNSLIVEHVLLGVRELGNDHCLHSEMLRSAHKRALKRRYPIWRHSLPIINILKSSTVLYFKGTFVASLVPLVTEYSNQYEFGIIESFLIPHTSRAVDKARDSTITALYNFLRPDSTGCRNIGHREKGTA